MTEGAAITARAPAVVAVLVTRDPGPWFDEVLDALAGQDYENLSVLVLVSGGAADPTERVARRLPEAFVRRLDEDRGFGAAVGEAMTMVEGASFFLLCHDDCAPAPDAVHLMVEESFRSNAGIVSPKMVRWDDPRVLLHVGQSADKTGAVVERVQDGEVDAGQHDAVRDVFCAPGGCTLVRGDLLRALGGYDPALVALGEDLDLSWRAHVAGARIVVAPAATVRHHELLAAGHRPPPSTDAPSLQALQRRNELSAVLTCYSLAHLVRVLPQALALALGELLVAALAGDRRRARAVVHAWRWNLARRRELRRRRAALARMRALADSDVRTLQVRGSARLATYLSRLVHQGLDAAHGRAAGPRGSVARTSQPRLRASRGTRRRAAPRARRRRGSSRRAGPASSRASSRPPSSSWGRAGSSARPSRCSASSCRSRRGRPCGTSSSRRGSPRARGPTRRRARPSASSPWRARWSPAGRGCSKSWSCSGASRWVRGGPAGSCGPSRRLARAWSARSPTSRSRSGSTRWPAGAGTGSSPTRRCRGWCSTWRGRAGSNPSAQPTTVPAPGAAPPPARSSR